MGYTHYIYRPVEINDQAWANIMNDTKKVLDCVQKKLGIKIGDGSGKKKPIITEDVILFNGDASKDHDHETGGFDRVTQMQPWEVNEGNNLKFEFCKTAHKPYDIAVTAFYTIVKHHVPECKVSSDGGPEGFEEGVVLCHDVLGYPFGENPVTNED